MRQPMRLGTGIGWRPEIADAVERMPGIDWVEAVAENVCPGHVPESLLRLRERGVTVVPHGVSLGLGGADRPDESRLVALAERAEALGSPLVTEHIAFVRAGGPLTASPLLEAGHLLPVPRTRDALDVLCANIRAAQAALPVPLAVENIAAIVSWPGEEMTEGQFLYDLVDRTGVRLLVDVANLHTNRVNRGEDPAEALDELPVEAIAYVHVAGGFERDGVWHDSHAHPVPRPVLDILADLASRVTLPGVLLERDENFPEPAELERELTAIRETVRWAGAPAGAPAHGTAERSGDTAAPADRTSARPNSAAAQADGTARHAEAPSPCTADGTAGQTDGTSAQAGGSSVQAGGTAVQADGTPAQADGTAQASDTAAQAGDSSAEPDGTAGQTDGTSAQADGTAGQTDGTSAQAGGSSVQADGTSTQADGTAVQPGDTSVQADGAAVETGHPAIEADDTGAVRLRLGLAQAALLSALVAGTPVPEGFDRVRIGVQARALAAKRADVVAKVAPELPEILADGYRPAFLAYAQRRPMTGGYRRDALDFAEHLLLAGLPEGARTRRLRAWWLERSGPVPLSGRPVARLARATRRALLGR
ncbi:multinuclear nonheme iron-dependent oxidase [Streptomyces sp. NBC_00358]|uniref:multinuclear nonheme iron-dependent oxidase n=1 Tax=Streptomyces sp. NBC_00358 TaxID=2975725 RepID=UPI002E25612C